MGKETVSLEKQIKENIRKYSLGTLLGEREMASYFDAILGLAGMEMLLTDRNDQVVAKAGSAVWDEHALENVPSRVIDVQGRTMGHLYAKYADGTAFSEKEENFMDAAAQMLMRFAGAAYVQKETALYIDIREEAETPGMKLHNLEKEDGLTGVFNKNYFDNRVKIIERSGVIPVAVMMVNINDWKFVNDNYGDDESDRLIQIIARILRNQAKEEYVIGRVDGDVFEVLIPMAEDGEAEDYAKRVQEACESYEDEKLAPSVAIGIEYKTNVEETIEDKLSDAEYVMFENKIEMKAQPGYRERLQKGLK